MSTSEDYKKWIELMCKDATELISLFGKLTDTLVSFEYLETQVEDIRIKAQVLINGSPVFIQEFSAENHISEKYRVELLRKLIQAVFNHGISNAINNQQILSQK